MKLLKNSISRQFLIPTLALVAGLGIFMTLNTALSLRGAMASKGNAMADFMSKIGVTSYLSYDFVSMEGYVKEITRDPEIAFAVFTDAQGKPVTRTSVEPASLSSLMVFERTISADDASSLGRLRLGYRRDALTASIWKSIFIVAAVIIVVAFAISFLMNRIIIRRVRETAERIRDVAQGEGDLTKRLHVSSDDELSDLATWFNTFLDNLQKTIASVQGNIRNVSQASSDFRTTAASLKQQTNDQRGQTEQVATAMTEMTQTIVDVAKNAADTATASEMAARTAAHGRETVEKTMNEMLRIADTVGKAAGTVGELGKSSAQIGEIVSVINSIAEQGRGFAVVADEVRKLAERTSKATQEIAEMVKKIQSDTEQAVVSMTTGKSEVETGVKLVEEAKKALEHIVETSKQDVDRVRQIATASEEQSTVAEEVSRNMETILSITTQTSQATDSIAASADNLDRLSHGLQEQVGWFKTGAPSSGAAG
jgi:methyl-accepting chemotaxis protein